MNILLVNPNQMQPPVAPIALDYLAEALSRGGFQCQLLDLCWESIKILEMSSQWLKKRASFNPDAVIVTLRNLDDAYYFSQASFLPQFQRIVTALKQAFEKPVIVGGSCFSIAPEAIFSALQPDFGISGAAEGDLLGLLEQLHCPEAYPGLPGLVWMKEGDIQSNRPSPPVMIQEFFSARRWIDNRKYTRHGGMVGLETKRGCPAGCRYCVDPLCKGSGTFAKALPVLMGEIQSLIDQGASVFHLCDSEFNLPHEHARTTCEAIIEAGLADKIRWYTYATPVDFDDTLAGLMAEAGCAGINFGIDHCVPEILHHLGRKHGPADLERTAQACQKTGLNFMFDLLLGGPGETRDTVRQVIEMCQKLEVPRVGTNVGLRLYPSTPLAAELLTKENAWANPSLAGRLKDNDQLLYPVFYCSHLLGKGWQDYLKQLIKGDPRFFLPIEDLENANYNYNENQVLVEAIQKGHRGAFWDILHRLQEGLAPLEIPA